MRDTWLVHNFEYVMRRTAPIGVFSSEPYVWIDSLLNQAYVLFGGAWIPKTPDRTISTDSGNVFIIESITDVSDYVTMQGNIVTIGGDQATW